MQEQRKLISVRLTPENRKLVSDQAKKIGISENAVISLCISQYFDKKAEG